MNETKSPYMQHSRHDDGRMTREKAIQILSTRDAHGVLCGFTSGVTKALNMAIEALSADAVQGWIPCSERLPNEERHYLCCNKGYLPFIAHYHDEQWHCFDGTTSHVDAWMPLPTPYKGGDDK